jgi:TonB-dependent starch-binding outer membrane protein SusC
MNENHVIQCIRRVTKNLLNKYAILAVMLCSLGIATAQNSNGKVSGTVSSASNGEPLIGVSVMVVGTNQGSVTDFNGAFEVQAKAGQTIKFSYVGYATQEIKVTGANLAVKLKENENTLDELIVVGYGVQKKKLVTGATSSVKGDDLQKLNTTNALQAMQGKAAGVNITSTSGQPGGGIKVNIRGVGTIGNSSPLYVVDGVISGDITYLNNSDIASIDVLKDAASCAIYGVNGANGVVLVTTKTGSAKEKKGGQISFDAYWGIQNAARKTNMLNAQEYATIANEAAINSGKLPYFTQSQISALGTGTNWLDQMISKNVPTQNYSLSASGGNESSTYSLGLSYTQQGGIVGGTSLSNYKRYNFRSNTEHKMYGTFLKVGQHFTFSHNDKIGVQDGDQYSNSLRGALSTSPLLAMYDADGNFLSSSNSTVYNDGTWTNTEANPYALMKLTNQNNTKSDKILGDVYAEIQPIKNLKIKSSFGLDYYGSTYHSYTPIYDLSAYAVTTYEKISQNSSTSYSWNWENTANYTFKVNENNFDVMIGSNILKTTGTWISGSNSGTTYYGDFSHSYLSLSTNTTNATLMSLSGNANAIVSRASFFGRINYNYKETYMATAVLRRDGSTMFAKGNQWGTFPSFSLGWVASNESFMESTKSWLDFLKVRAGWGSNGNDNIAKTFQYLSLVYLSNAQYNLGTTEASLTSGSYPATLGNTNLKWERSQQFDVGFDASFLNSHLNLNMDVYNKVTKDWLVMAPLYATEGVSENPYINGGSVTNNGIEVQLAYNNTIGKDFKYTISGTYSYNKNRVTDIPTSDGIIHGGSNILYDNAGEFFRAESGQPLGYFWGYKTAGVFQNEAEVQAWKSKSGTVLQPNAEPGDLKYVDVNGDGEITSADKTNIGDPNPHHMFGFSLSCNYKNFDLGVTANGVAGNKIVQSYRNMANRFGNWTTAILGRWHGEGTSNFLPRVTEDNSNWTNFSDIYVQDGSYLRIANVTLGYDFAKTIKFKQLTQLRVYVAAENLFTFTKYNGMDPEVGYSAQGTGDYNFGSGVDLGYYPRPQTFLVGINVKF